MNKTGEDKKTPEKFGEQRQEPRRTAEETQSLPVVEPIKTSPEKGS